MAASDPLPLDELERGLISLHAEVQRRVRSTMRGAGSRRFEEVEVTWEDAPLLGASLTEKMPAGLPSDTEEEEPLRGAGSSRAFAPAETDLSDDVELFGGSFFSDEPAPAAAEESPLTSDATPAAADAHRVS